MATGVGSTYAINTWIRYPSVGNACTKVICANSTFIGDIEPRVLAKLGVTLVGLGVIDCYF